MTVRDTTFLMPGLFDHCQSFISCVFIYLQVLCKTSGSTLGYGFATLMEDADDSSSEEDEPLRPMSLSEAIP